MSVEGRGGERGDTSYEAQYREPIECGSLLILSHFGFKDHEWGVFRRTHRNPMDTVCISGSNHHIKRRSGCQM